jgi:hypothetical protein
MVERAYGSKFAARPGIKWMVIRALVRAVSILSFGHLSGTHSDLTLLISKNGNWDHGGQPSY